MTFEAQNELDQHAMGGTELMGMRLEKHVDRKILDQCQIVRSRFRGFDESKPYHIFWEHDLPDDPEAVKVFGDEKVMAKFDAFVFVSYWQRDAFNYKYKIDPAKVFVAPNAIEPINAGMRRDHKKGEPIRLIYTPTPHRGLSILATAVDAIHTARPDISLVLDVYSSFALYGWEQRDHQYDDLFDYIRQREPWMKLHGTVSNDEIRNALLHADIFAYPSIWPETSCLCLIEAMSAKCAVVTSDLAAIPETSCGMVPMVRYTPDYNTMVKEYTDALLTVVDGLNNVFKSRQATDAFSGYLGIRKAAVDSLHNVNYMNLTWATIFKSIVSQREASNR